MSVNARLSLTNHWNTATVAATTTTANYPASNVKDPSRPALTWRSTVVTDSDLRANHGSAKLVELVLLLNVNFTSVRFEANATDAWGAPTYNSGALVVGRNKWNDRYTLALLTSPAPTLQWNRLFIPTQATTDGAAYFEVGGVYAGPLTALPREWRVAFRMRTVRPVVEVEATLGKWRNRYITGDPFTRISMQRVADLSVTTPFTGDQVESYLDLDRLWWAAGFGALYLNRGNTAHAWVARMGQEPEWDVNGTIAESDMEIEEVIAG